jgi:DNA-binding CsgD family transcriptional regulator
MTRITCGSLRAALDTLHAVAADCDCIADVARRGVARLPILVPSELTTLVVCDLDTGHRRVTPTGALSRRDIAAFDRHFHAHPLVRHHGRNPRAVTRRIADLASASAFRRSALYADYYRAIGIDQVIAVPLHVDRRYLVSFVMNRWRTPFTDAERDLLELLRPHLADVYRLAAALDAARGAPPPWQAPVRLTPRESEVLRWVAAGKTNRDVADIVGARPRTVEKHLERIYAKLGVETRTAAAMRARG